MLTKFKKSFTIALAVVLCLSTVCASAATWRFKGYDNRPAILGSDLVVPMCYEEYDDAGFFTGRKALGNEILAYSKELVPYAKAELKNPWLDIAYPNAEYAGVYANGTFIGANWPTGRNGLMNLVEYKDVDYMWEVAAPFGIYSITKAKLNINGVAQWFGTPEMGYPTQYTGRNADVKVNKFAYGFGAYEITGANEVTLIPAKLAGYVDADITANIYGITAAELAPKTAQPTKSIIASKAVTIPRSYDYALVGPAYDELGNEIPGGKTVVASKYEGNPANFGVANLISVVRDRNNNITNCEITWTAGGYELVTPHYVYEWLTVDGVVMDGSYIGNIAGQDYWKPAIAVYTGAVASNVFAN